MHPLPPGNPYSYITKAQLHPVDNSPWLGQAVHGPYRRPYTVQRVYTTPFGVDVALCLNEYDKALELEVTEMLSTPERPAARRTEYLRNYRQLLRLHRADSDGKATPQTHRAIQRRTVFYQQFNYARIYVETALLEGVQAGDRVVTIQGVQMTVLDPNAERCPGMGWRTHMHLKVTPQYREVVDRWGWHHGEGTYHIRHQGWGLLPTLGLV
ncbi:hypothetical protein [Streptomyces sp. XH2]|uniref:hypothetical protein n=1 Tax=Streptomyces sp. XH2 TaxID=3412483 RepID=UPI003C7A6A78